MKKIIIAIIFLIVIGSFAACQNKQTIKEEVDAIYVYHSSFGIRDTEFKIDFKEKKFYEFYVDDNLIERNELADNEGFQEISQLGEDKLDKFLKKSEKLGFYDWEERYDNPNIVDGHQWGIKIMFTDGRKKEISGSNEYPSTWDKMYDEFERLTGENILMLKSDWLDN